MILSFGDAATADLYHGIPSARARRFPPDILRTARRKLDMLEAAHRLVDIALRPGNRLEWLAGDRGGTHSIRINRQWRIVFRWTEKGPLNVSLTDYH